MDRLVIETEEDWTRVKEIVRSELSDQLDAMLAQGYEIIPPGFGSWQGMIKRCSTGNKSRPDYAARGIRVCERWRKFENFLADMGPRPTPEHSLDRIDVNGNYEPSNCRWATHKQQTRNRRITVFYTLDGVKRPLQEWAEITGINYRTLKARMLDGWSAEDALRTPAGAKRGNQWGRGFNDRRGTLGEGKRNSQGRKRAHGSEVANGAREGEEPS